jgi:hypothetical protein
MFRREQDVLVCLAIVLEVLRILKQLVGVVEIQVGLAELVEAEEVEELVEAEEVEELVKAEEVEELVEVLVEVSLRLLHRL